MVDEGVVGYAARAGAQVVAGSTVSYNAFGAINNTLPIDQIVTIKTLLANSRIAATDTLRLRTIWLTVQLISAQYVLRYAVFAGELILAQRAIRNAARLDRTAVETVHHVACFADLAPVLPLHVRTGHAVEIGAAREHASGAICCDNQARTGGAVGAGSGGATDTVRSKSDPAGSA